VNTPDEQLRAIIDTIPALVWSARPDGSAEFFNRRWLDYTGISYDEARDWGWTTAVHPEDREGLAVTWQRIRASEQLGQGEVRLRRHDGKYRWFLWQLSASEVARLVRTRKVSAREVADAAFLTNSIYRATPRFNEFGMRSFSCERRLRCVCRL
jgi:PAS domain S-box-containing protein